MKLLMFLEPIVNYRSLYMKNLLFSNQSIIYFSKWNIISMYNLLFYWSIFLIQLDY